MKIDRYSIPKLPRNKYGYTNVTPNGGGTTIILDVGSSTTVYNGLDSTSIVDALSANQGRVLNEKIIDADNRSIKQNECINISSLTHKSFSGLSSALNVLVNLKDNFKYDLHEGMLVKFKISSTGEWLTYIYIGTNVDYTSPNNWKLHAREEAVAVIDNLITDSATMALSARQGKILNEIKPSKTVDEVIDGKYDFTNGIKTKGIDLNDGPISSTDYDEANDHGTSIYPLKIKDEAGTIIDTKWNMTIDNLKVRDTLDVFTLLIEEARAIAGAIYCTKAGMKVSKVGEDKNIWRCYFNDKDENGNVVKYLQFRTNDFAFCQIFDGKNVKRYWYLVTGTNLDLPDYTGEPFIDLKKPAAIWFNAIPDVGDEIIQLGNATDPERQGALIIEPLKISIYNGINTTILPEPIITLNPLNSKIDAETINFIGKTIINGSFIVDDKGNLTVKGHVEANTGNIGRFDINDKGLFNDADAKGLGEITMIDKAKGIGFKLGTDYKELLTTCYITNDDNTALKVDSMSGTGLIAGHLSLPNQTQKESLRLGMAVYNGAKIQGLMLNAETLAYTNPDKFIKSKLNDVVFLLPTDNNLKIHLEATNDCKILYFVNKSRYEAQIVSDIYILANVYGERVNGIKIPGGTTLILVNDSGAWTPMNTSVNYSEGKWYIPYRAKAAAQSVENTEII